MTDPFAEINADEAIQAGLPYPDLNIQANDWLLLRKQDAGEPGQLVLALVDGMAAVCRYEPGMLIRGLLAGVYRSLA